MGADRRRPSHIYMIHRQAADFVQGYQGKVCHSGSKCYAGHVDPELQQALAQLEVRLTARIDAAEARTEERITRLEERITRLDERITRLDERITRLEERIEATETKLLTEFHKWASPSEARQRTHAAALRAIDLEMESLSDCVGKLEGKQPH